MSDTYQQQVNDKCEIKINEVVKELPDFCKKYFYNLKLTKAPRTRLIYAYDTKRFFDWLRSIPSENDANTGFKTPHEMLDVLTVDDLHEYLNDICSNNSNSKSTAFLARNIATLKSFFKYYYRLGEIEKNLGDFIDTPQIKDKEIKILDNEQTQRILDAVFDTSNMTKKQLDVHKNTTYRDHAILTLFFTTGMRVSELVGLDIDNIDFKDKSLITTRKGGNQDTIYLSDNTIDAINNYLTYERTYLKGNTDEVALFISQKHARMSVQAIENMIKKYAKLAGVNVNVTPHTLRRTFGTNLYNHTGDIDLVATVLHHSSVDTTRKHYAKVSNEHKKIAANIADDLYNKNNS